MTEFEQKIIDALEDLKKGQHRLEQKLDKLDSEHDETKEKTTKLQKDIEYVFRDQVKFIEGYEKNRERDKDLIYQKIRENEEKSEKISIRAAKEATKDVKLWVYAGIIFTIITIVTVLSKMK